MEEKFVVKLTSGVEVSHIQGQTYIVPMRWQLLTGIAHTTKEMAKEEIAFYMQAHPMMNTTVYKVDSYFIQNDVSVNVV